MSKEGDGWQRREISVKKELVVKGGRSRQRKVTVGKDRRGRQKGGEVSKVKVVNGKVSIGEVGRGKVGDGEIILAKSKTLQIKGLLDSKEALI